MRTATLYRIRSGWLVIPVVLIVLAIIAWFWASPQPYARVVTAWGLPGVWQQDCAAPVGMGNPQYRYSIEHDKILLRRDFGSETRDTSVISDVATTSGGEIQYVVHFAQLGNDRRARASRQNVLAKAADGRIRTVSNKLVGTAEESVVAGMRTADRKPTPWMTRCRLE